MIVDAKCNHCGAVEERIVNSRTDWSTMECKQCSHGLLEKVDKLYVPNVQYKGSGWFSTDGKY